MSAYDNLTAEINNLTAQVNNLTSEVSSLNTSVSILQSNITQFWTLINGIVVTCMLSIGFSCTFLT